MDQGKFIGLSEDIHDWIQVYLKGVLKTEPVICNGKDEMLLPHSDNVI